MAAAPLRADASQTARVTRSFSKEKAVSNEKAQKPIPRLDHYSSAESIFEAVSNNDVALLKASWLVELAQVRGGVLGKRQELPPEAHWKGKELFHPNGSMYRILAAVSHVWLTKDHPDPDGRNLSRVAEVLSLLMPVFGDFALYWDWASLYQEPRGPEEQLAFERSLQDASLWWMHTRILKLLLTTEPPGYSAQPYGDRGWPTFEREVSFMVTPANMVLDLALFGEACQDHKSTIDTCKANRPPPTTPKHFSLRLGKKRFAHDADRGLVNRLYQECFMSWISGIEELNFQGHNFNDEQITQLAAAVRHCGRLKHLDLAGNRVTNEGAKRLAAAIPRCRRLVLLELQGNHICHLGEALLREAWRASRKPAEGLRCIAAESRNNSCKTNDEDDEELIEEKDPDFFYEGMYKNNQRHGQGMLCNRISGFRYEGQFKDDLPHGYGDASWQDGSKYNGQWCNGQKGGKGEFISNDGLRYLGEWQAGHRHGQGMQEYEDGGRYSGNWVNGLCCGEGTYYFTNGSWYEGLWTKGRYNGPGVMHNQDGTTERLDYKHGLLVTREVVETKSLPMVAARSGSTVVMSLGRTTVRQWREDVHKPIRLPSLKPSKKLIGRVSDDIDLSAPPLRPRSPSRTSVASFARAPLTCR